MSTTSGKGGLGFMEDSQEAYSEVDQVEWMGNLGATQTGYAPIIGTKTVPSMLGTSW